MADHEAETTDAAQEPAELRVDLIKSNLFRVIHADGAWGGLTPQGNIHMALYSERSAIPTQIVFAFSAAGEIGPEIVTRRVTRGTLVREVEADVVLSIDAAQSLYTWLGEKIAQHTKIFEEAKG